MGASPSHDSLARLTRPSEPGRIARRPPAHRLLDRWLRRLLRRRLREAPLVIELADGTRLSAPELVEPVARLRFHDRLSFLDFLRDPESRFGEVYCDGRVEVEGDLVAALEEAYRALKSPRRVISGGRSGHSPRASRRNARRHYDLGNDFYRLWLDEQMLYTCAYFPSAAASLEEAQIEKMQRICRKLRLEPGERVVEAGCGWGALARHMARHHGVHVTAYNVSGEQVRHARERAAAEGLADRVVFVEDDYRSIEGRYDAFVSVGMLEHVGRQHYAALGGVILRSLDPTRGRGLLHFIGRDQPRELNPWIRRWIFPGAYPPTLGEAIGHVVEGAGLAVLDVENMRPHYVLTLSHWRSRFESSFRWVVARYGERFARAWRLYLAGSEAAFRVGSLELFQVVFAPVGAGSRWSRV